MAGMDLRDLNGLIIDDIPEMRTSLRIQLADSGLERCTAVRNIREAMEKLQGNYFDFVICDYKLDQGADGQQFLELVRRKKLLPLTTAFLMVTGETGYQQVSTAAEYSPDDYLLKPFTADTLAQRLLRILEKKRTLAAVYKHMGGKANLDLALTACDKLLLAKTPYLSDVLRLKCELLLSARRHAEALKLYDRILEQRSAPWVVVGKAQALRALGDEAQARALLEESLQVYPNFLAAYDQLADLLVKSDSQAAQEIVERAMKISASTQRQRELGALALGNGDFAGAEQAYRAAVDKDRTGFFKNHDDYAGLARSCVEQGKTKEALVAVKDMGQHFQRTPELLARQAALECQVQQQVGNTELAVAAMEKAMAVAREGGLPAAASLEVAQACFAMNQTEEARHIIQAVVEEYHENDAMLARAQKVFDRAGLQEEGASFLEATCKHMIRLNNDAVALAKSGELEQSIIMLVEAADRLPNNAQVAINAAQALLMLISRQGMDAARLAEARRYLEQAIKANPEHAKLPAAMEVYRQVAPAGTPALVLPV